MAEYKIPIYRPHLGGNEKKYVNECLDSTWISSKGKFVSEFERKFADYMGIGHAATVSNGTTALHLALLTLGIGNGDEVIVPTLTYIASVNAISYTGATPVFVDSLATTWQMDPSDIRRKITGKTKGIVVVHLYGHPCEMDEIMSIAREFNLYVVEDCAEAFGTLYKDKHIGNFGHISTYSFFGNKTITTGEGGMVVTNDTTLYERAVHFKGQGLALNRQYWHDVIGYNYRMTNICAAIGLAQLEQAELFIKNKRRIAEWYIRGLQNLPVEVHREVGDVFHTYWMFSILVEDEIDRDALRNHLEALGIETRPLFYPAHTMPMYAENNHRYPIAENLGRRGINLPSWPMLEESQVEWICSAIGNYYKDNA
jgi:perosamine synthetase